jgi:hypothetical protein
MKNYLNSNNKNKNKNLIVQLKDTKSNLQRVNLRIANHQIPILLEAIH